MRGRSCRVIRDQVRVVEGRPVGVGEGVTELATLVDRARHLSGDVTRDPARERELAEEPAHTVLVTAGLRVHLAPRPLEPRVRHDRRPAVTRARDEERVQTAVTDATVRVGPHEVRPGVVPQCPSSLGLTSSRDSGRRSSGLSRR